MADTALTGSIPSVASTLGANEWMQHGRAILFTMIWSSYFLRSQRVKKTFIERHGRSEAVAPDTPSSSAVPEPA
jgi:hypothetical protein